MKRITIFWMTAVILATGLFGCAGAPMKSTAPPGVMLLDEWLEGSAFTEIEEQLKTSSFMRDMPFLIVKIRGEAVEKRIDGLTEDIRDRLVPRFRKMPQIKLVLRHPVSDIDRPYDFKDLRCGAYKDIKMLLAIDIKRLGPPGDNLARVSIGAVDVKKSTWVQGFSVYKKVALTPTQSADLGRERYDESLRGLRYLPFNSDQHDQMAAYLARNLSCVFRNSAAGEDDVTVYVESGKVTGRNNKRIVKFLAKQLNYCNEIKLVNNKENADWILMAEALETGGGAGLHQFWVEMLRREGGELVRGLATHAYFFGGDQLGAIDGRWTVRNLESNRETGLMVIHKTSRGEYTGNLFRSDGRTARKLGIQINLSGNEVNWIYYDPVERKTYEAAGVLRDDTNRMSVTVSNFPSSGDATHLELTRVE